MPVDDNLLSAAERVAPSENEQEIVEKLIVPLLGVLELGPDDFVPQPYVRLATFGKGETLRTGYRPDHLIRLEGYNLAVLEAKKSSVPVIDAWREACEYAQFLNRNEPWSNAIEVVVGCNGREIAVGSVTTADRDVLRKNVLLMLRSPQMFSELELLLSRKVLLQKALEIKASRGVFDASSARAKIFRSSAIPKDKHNPIASGLRQVLDQYFVDLTRFSDDDFRASFCDPPSGSVRREVEEVIRDRAPAGTQAERLTRENADENLGSIASRFHAEVTNGRTPTAALNFVLILGDAGAGKSTLLEWYRRFSNIGSKFCFVRIDGAAAPQEPEHFFPHVLKTACEEGEYFYRTHVAGGDHKKTVRDICAPKAQKQRMELYSHLDKETYYQDHFPSLATQLQQNHSEYLTLVLRSLHASQIAMCVFLDNLDQTNIARQVEGFRTLRPFSMQFPLLCVLTLREETYRSHENREPFNAFHRSNVFHIPAPTAADVINKRLQLVEHKFGGSDHALASYKQGQFTFELSRDGAARCLRSIADQLIASSGHLSLIDGVCGHNVRKALDAFSLVCTSSHIGEEALIAVHQRFENFRPSHDSLVRALVCGDWQYYCRESPMVANVFQLVQGTSGQSLLYTLHLLQVLFSHASDTHKAGKGYIDVEALQSALRIRLDVTQLVLRRLLFDLHGTGLWQLDTLSPKDYLDFEFARISTPGLFLLWTLYKEPAYLECTAFDTHIDDPAVLEVVVGRIENGLSPSGAFRQYLRDVEQGEVKRARSRGLNAAEAGRLFFP